MTATTIRCSRRPHRRETSASRAPRSTTADGSPPVRTQRGEPQPPLEIAAVPTDADSLALVVDDPDAVEPAGRIWAHWLVWNVSPETATIPEGWTVDEAIEGENGFGEIGYDGPDPPDEPHGYRFKLHALNACFDLEEAIDGRVVARTQLTASYEPWGPAAPRRCLSTAAAALGRPPRVARVRRRAVRSGRRR
ncbi:YbhB/YbcL family Raf kinase inhibitor-like protein [Natronococcus sp. A-GB7]|uniref:YbhB/YbcL family Raf kinase inhibitor-like protein n=1 Tax=Natronococcus sp. A-GB7 TaxID=3037649 RepID=UPI0031BB9443